MKNVFDSIENWLENPSTDVLIIALVICMIFGAILYVAGGHHSKADNVHVYHDQMLAKANLQKSQWILRHAEDKAQLIIENAVFLQSQAKQHVADLTDVSKGIIAMLNSDIHARVERTDSNTKLSEMDFKNKYDMYLRLLQGFDKKHNGE